MTVEEDLKTGLAQSAAGEVHDLGSFSQYAPTAEDNVKTLKKVYRKAQYISADFRGAQSHIESAIELLKKADYSTGALEEELIELKAARDEARIYRKAAAHDYYEAKKAYKQAQEA